MLQLWYPNLKVLQVSCLIEIPKNIMGWFTIRCEPESMEPLRRDVEAFIIFEDAGWTSYFERLIGFDEEVSLQFAQNLMEYYSKVGGMRIEVSEEIIVELTGMLRT